MDSIHSCTWIYVNPKSHYFLRVFLQLKLFGTWLDLLGPPTSKLFLLGSKALVCGQKHYPQYLKIVCNLLSSRCLLQVCLTVIALYTCAEKGVRLGCDLKVTLTCAPERTFNYFL